MPVYNGQVVIKALDSPSVETGGLKVGDVVTVKPSSKWTNGTSVVAFVYTMKMHITSVDGNSGTAVISTSPSGPATGRIVVGCLVKI